MDETARSILRYLIHVLDGVAQTAFVGVPKAREAIKPDIDALHKMVEENRPPTQEEWDAHDASMTDLRNRLHGP